jgi:hypothetical protein
MKTLWEKIKDWAALLFAAVAGLGIAALAVIFYFIPKRDEQKRREASQKAQTIKTKVEEAHVVRQQKVDQQIAVVKEETKAAQAQDPVDFANDLINKG